MLKPLSSKESEKDTEKYLAAEVKKVGGQSYKWTSPGRNGVPDRICLFPDGVVVFVELKSEGAKPSKLQLLEHADIRALGFVVLVIDTKAGVQELIKTWRSK